MNDDMMAEMMKQMEGLVESGEFNNALEGMMEQLMTKDVLYEPMKDLADRVGDTLAINNVQPSISNVTTHSIRRGSRRTNP